MRTDCKHYESRTYSSGEVVRRCALDLAPEAPWKCPENCAKYERRMIDVGWQYGTLSKGMQPSPPELEVTIDNDAAALLDSAEDIVNAAGAELFAEQERKARKKLFRKRKKK
jgi:hypothetical protein